MASGDTLVTGEANGAIVSLTTDAQFGKRNNHFHLAFDAASDETARFSFIMPMSYTNVTGVDVILHWATTSATSGNIVATVEFERISGGQDIDSDGFASAVSVTQAVNGTSGVIFTSTHTFSAGSGMDSVVGGDGARIRVTRDADNGSDTATGDAELYRWEIRER